MTLCFVNADILGYLVNELRGWREVESAGLCQSSHWMCGVSVSPSHCIIIYPYRKSLLLCIRLSTLMTDFSLIVARFSFFPKTLTPIQPVPKKKIY